MQFYGFMHTIYAFLVKTAIYIMILNTHIEIINQVIISHITLYNNVENSEFKKKT